MPGRTPKYTKIQTQEIKMTCLDALLESSSAMTTAEIKAARPSIAFATDQKLARVLSELCEFGLVQKGHSKAKNRMVYIATENMGVSS